MVFSMFSYKKEFVHKTFTHLTIKNEKLKSPLALKLYKKITRSLNPYEEPQII